MAKKILNIISSAYRATIEEQDDTIVWLSHAMKGQGADVDVLLKGKAVNYAVKAQNAAGISIGAWSQRNPPDLVADVTALMSKGVQVYVLADDAAMLGLEPSDLVSGVKPLFRKNVAELFGSYDYVWTW